MQPGDDPLRIPSGRSFPADASAVPGDTPGRDSIASRTAQGATWLLSWRVLTRIIGFLSTLVLARLLTPADFGIIALGMAMSAALEALTFAGVQEQLIRIEAADRDLFDTGFTINAMRSVVLASALALGSTWLAGFFGDKRLLPVVLALAVCQLLGGFENIGIVEYRRRLNFRKDVQLAAVPRLVSAVTVLTAAFVFRDYRALIVALVVGRLVQNQYSYMIHPYRPRFSLRSWRKLTSFSLWSWGNGVVNFLRIRADNLIIARVLGPTSLGIYAVAQEISSLPFSELIQPIGQVLFAGFAAVRQAGSGVDSAYARALGSVFLLVLPATVGVAFIAEPATALLFGPQWMAAVPLIRILAMTGTLMVCTVVGRVLLSSFGWPRINFQIALAATIVRLPLIAALTVAIGMRGAAIGVLCGTFVEETLFLVVTMRHCGASLAMILGQVWRPCFAAAAMAGALFATGGWWQPRDLATIELMRSLAIAVPGGAAVFLGALLLAWLAAGRPQGAEVEIARHGTRILGTALRATRRRLAPLPGAR
ncbi:MAG TPA: lipopolysaccharide biosynthesis protein [Acetobacteraceae bacterium]|nr:lipopolysaccharide biosynthesis protein [Acetobacteraceae bacterium]